MLKLFTVCLLSLSTAAYSAETAPVDNHSLSLIELGRRIYQDGIVESGEKLRGVSVAQVTFSGKQAACIRCHRKSGFGTSEGTNIITPITGEFIFPEVGAEAGLNADISPKTQQQQRARFWVGESTAAYTKPVFSTAAYTQSKFSLALSDGIDSAGQPMDQLMPRYALSDREVAALVEYLKSLSAYSEPSVDKTTIHFATVIMPGANPVQSEAMSDVLKAFVADMNSDSRSLKRRRSVATHAMYRSYREWKLHVWTLTGPAEGWKAQLEQLYREQPVFAVLSGVGGDNWRPLHEFCEQQEVPCMFPNSDLPVIDDGYYTFYFSRGMTLEAEVLARQFNTSSIQGGGIVQVFRKDDNRGVEAARVLREKMKETDGTEYLLDWPVPDGQINKLWQQMLVEQKPEAVVLWVNGEDLAELGGWDDKEFSPQQIFLSASMLGSELGSKPDLLPKSLHKFKKNIRLIYPFKIPEKSARYLIRTKLWLRNKKIALTDERVQANTYFAAKITGEALSHLLSHYSRDYFIELIEHMIGRSLVTSVYPQLNLGPGQRFASKGAYLVKYSDRQGKILEPITGWVVPY